MFPLVHLLAAPCVQHHGLITLEPLRSHMDWLHSDKGAHRLLREASLQETPTV